MAWRGGAALLASCACGVIVHAQDSPPPGIAATLAVTQQLEYSDNPNLEENGESDFFGRTILRFGLNSVTSLDRFSLSLGTDIEEGVQDESSINFTNGVFGLSYQRATQSSSISTNLSYRESDVQSDTFDEDFDQDGNVINQDRGTRQSYAFGLNGTIGQDAPIGAEYGLSYREIRYSGVDEDDFTDSSTFNMNGRINFNHTARITTRLIGRYSDFDAQGDGVNREATGLGVGASLQVNPVVTADVALLYDRIERSGNETGTDDGISFDSSLTRSFKNGSLSLQFNTDVTSNDDGRRTFIGMNRNLDLPRAQAFSYSFGLTQSEGTGIDPIFGLDYAYSLPTSTISVGLSQTVIADSDNDEEINTSLRANYDYDINSLSRLSAGIAFFNRNELGDNPNDGQRFNISLSYRYALTEDWGLVSGYRYVRSTEDNREDRDSNTVFLGLQRDFDWRP